MSTRPTGPESPAEKARRALREARRADAAQRDEERGAERGAEQGVEWVEAGGSAASVAPVADGPPAGQAADHAADRAGGAAATDQGAQLGTHPGARPGDVAREALRAARRGGATGREGAEDAAPARDVPGAAPVAPGSARAADAPRTVSGTRSAAGRGGQSAEVVEELKRLARAGRRSIPEPGTGGPSSAAEPQGTGPGDAGQLRDVAGLAPRAVDADADADGGSGVEAGAGAAVDTSGAETPGPGPGTLGPETPDTGTGTDGTGVPDPTRTASAAARSALARAGAERRRALRGTGQPVRGARRRRATASGPPAHAATDPRATQPRTLGPDAFGPAGLSSPSSPSSPSSLSNSSTSSSPSRRGSAPGAVRGAQATDDLRRTFPAALPGSTRTAASGSGKGGSPEGSWWGAAWVRALEESALDPARLARGRAYEEGDKVDAVTVTPGLVLAYVHGSRPRPYRAKISLPTFTDEEWDRFLDAAAAQPGHIAALLDRQMPRSLADCGVPLLPVAGELRAECSCPDSGHPCKHAAALCYRTARLLDEDPFVLLLLRGGGERGLLAELSRRNATLAARSGASATPVRLPGVRARDVLAARTPPPLPRPQPPLPQPGQPPAYPAAPGGPDPFALDQLATDAAARAHALLATGSDPVAELTLWQDAVRIAAGRPGSGLTAASRAQYESLAAAADRTATDLARAVAAWRQGGADGLAALEEPWDPPAGRFDQARPALRAAEFPLFTPWRNHLTHPEGTLQLRLGRDGLWYAYESEPGRDDWWPRGTPDLDPVGALTAVAA